MGVRASGDSFAMRVPSLIVEGAFRRPDREILLACPAFEPSAAGSWFAPDGSAADYWRSAVGAVNLHAALDGLEVGQVIKSVRLQFYRGTLSNPSIGLYNALAGASASVVTPTVAWSNPTSSTNWQTLVATYSHNVIRANYSLLIGCNGAGDRVRMATVTVGDA